jgi:hypothetical protein
MSLLKMAGVLACFAPIVGTFASGMLIDWAGRKTPGSRCCFQSFACHGCSAEAVGDRTGSVKPAQRGRLNGGGNWTQR